MRILIIDKDKSYTQGIAFFLRNQQMIVDSYASSEEGTEMARLYDYDLIMLDYALSDNAALVKKMRSAGIETPIIMLSTISASPQKVSCFNAGADDYVIKPCDKNELYARILAIIRRSRGYSQSKITIGEMCVDLESKIITIKGQILHLTSKEYALIELLCLRRGMTVSKGQFLNHLYNGIDEPEMKIIDVFLCRIRNKIARLSGGKQYIQTVWGRGYILKED